MTAETFVVAESIISSRPRVTSRSTSFTAGDDNAAAAAAAAGKAADAATTARPGTEADASAACPHPGLLLSRLAVAMG